MARRAESARKAANRQLLADIQRLHDHHRKRYGAPRIHAALRAQGRTASRGRVERLMHRHGIRAQRPRAYRICTTDSNHARPVAPGLLHHSDRGSQYASAEYRKALKDYGMGQSMSRKGNCWDNACSETLFGSLKVERLHGQRFETIRQAKDETIAWLFWYNQTRMHSTLCYASPIQFENDWENALAAKAAA